MAMPTDDYLQICIDRVVPDDYQPARAETHRALLALEARQPVAREGELDAAGVIPVSRAAIVNLKKWETGRTLRCRFMDGSTKQRDKVRAKAAIWEKYAKIKFNFVGSGDAEIRISFSADTGSWS